MYYAVKYRVLLWTNNWAKYIDKDIKSQTSFIKKVLKCLPNRLTPLYYRLYKQDLTSTKNRLVLIENQYIGHRTN